MARRRTKSRKIKSRPSRLVLTKQIATSQNNPYERNTLGSSGDGNYKLLHQDTLLRNNEYGGDARSVELYLDIMTDDSVYYPWSRQLSDIVAQPWHIEPASESPEDEEVAEFITETLERLEYFEDQEKDNFTVATTSYGYSGYLRTLGLGTITGISPISCVWKQDEHSGKYIPMLRPIDPSRVGFEVNKGNGLIYPKLLTKKYSYDGIYMPYRSLLLYRYWAVPTSDPFGYGLGRFIYHLVQWRKEDLTYWLNIIDKFSDPTKVGTYPANATEEEVLEFQNALQRLGSDGTLTLPEGFTVEFQQNTGNADELLEQLREFTSVAISKIISGEATVGEKYSNGNNNKDTISNSVRLKKAQEWSLSFDTFTNSTLIKWLTEVNFPGRKPPRIVTEWVDKEELITTVERLDAIGYKVDPEYLEEMFDLPRIEEEPQPSKGRRQFNLPS